MALDGGEDVANAELAPELRGQGGNRSVRDAAWDDPIEPGQVVVAVQRETVHANAARDPDADRGDLAVHACRTMGTSDACRSVAGPGTSFAAHPDAAPALDPLGG